jgi:methylmalonyl-CoA mutase N-terminal domain/subunit
MTDEMERRAEEVFAHLEDLGNGSLLEGVYAGIENGWFVGEIADAAYRYEREVNAGERIVVGVNAFTEGDDPSKRRLLRIGQDTEDLQLKRLASVKQARDNTAVAETLAQVATGAIEPSTNLMPALINAARARVTVGELVDVLEAKFGTYVERVVV